MPYLILVESPSDAQFFRKLLESRMIKNLFHVRCPKEADGVNGNGNTRFREALNGFTVVPGFDDLLGILIVTDSDENPNRSFVAVQQQIVSTERGHLAPNMLLEKSSGKPAIVVMTIPWIDEVGNLETLCLKSAEVAPENSSIISCVDQFQSCTGISAWPPNKVSKARLRSIITAKYQRNCDLSVAFIWDNCPEIIPLSNPCFDQISDFLKSFPSLVAS